jgi:hypothetical protein
LLGRHDDTVAHRGLVAQRPDREQRGADQQEMNERIFDELRPEKVRALHARRV